MRIPSTYQPVTPTFVACQITLVFALFFAGVILAPVSQAQAVSKDTVFHSVTIAGNLAGVQKTWRDRDEVHFSFEFNDRGRGPNITQDVRLDASGVPLAATLRGHGYYKNKVEERFSFADGKGAWQSSAERGSSDRRGFYVSFDGVPGEYALLANALVKAGGRLPLLPAGEARIEKAGERSISASGRTIRVTQHAISGLGYTPQTVWLDGTGELFAVGSGWFMTVRKGWETVAPQLVKAQDSAADSRSTRLVRELARRPSGPVLFRNARLFDAESENFRENMSVLVTGNRITAVGTAAQLGVPANAEVFDLAGKTLMPGLWDMHVHSDNDEGLHHIAAGVTTVRDMANDTDEVLERRKRFGAGLLIGPRVIMAGFMDGPGPFAGPTKVLVDNEAAARKAVDRYADLGYVQIKIYSSIKPEIVPAIIDQAHKRGLKVSGHIPAFMTAEQLVKLGMDEIQHMNMLFLNFWGDSVKDTRTPLRFTAVAERAAGLDLSSPRVLAFVKLLKDRGVVVDPTVNIFEDMFTSRTGVPKAGYLSVAERLPPVVRRGLLSGGLPVPEGKDSVYRAALPAMLKLLKILYDAGIPIVAGTDAPAGFALHRELELYSMAGIPNAAVLRIATIGAAKVLGMQDSVGSIKAGKLADLIVVDGDPLRDMKDIRRVQLTMKDGVLHESARVYRALGVEPVGQRGAVSGASPLR